MWTLIFLLAVLYGVYRLTRKAPSTLAQGSPQPSPPGVTGAKSRSPQTRAKRSTEPAPPSRPAVPVATYEFSLDDLLSRGGPSSPDPDDFRWIPPGQSVTVQGFALTGGGLYVGERLASVSSRYNVEPALIRPGLKVDLAHPDTAGSSMSYYPSYSDIQPGARAAYLQWLAAGRRTPGAYIGYVFLYFYGLERRLLVDTERDPVARAGSPWILQEIESLLAVYGDSGSFSGYARRLLSLVSFRAMGTGARRYLSLPPAGHPWVIKDEVLLGLGQLVADGKTIPPEWALAWLRCQAQLSNRTPATRCRDEVEALFVARYPRRFDGGLRLKPNKTQLRLTYRPASASFSGQGFTEAAEGVPDLSAVQAPLAKLGDLYEQCVDDLVPFSRWLGRNPEGRGTVAALTVLPSELVQVSAERLAGDLLRWLTRTASGTRPVCIDSAALNEHLVGIAPADGRAWRKADGVTAAQLLERLGFGMEPDVRFGGPCPDKTEKIALFVPDGPPMEAPSEAYQAAMLTLHLAAAVVVADGVVTEAEERHLEAQIERALHLTPGERTRLRAHMAWLLAAHPGHKGLKARLAGLDAAAQAALADLLLAVSAQDGAIDPKEVKVLEQLFTALGQDTARLYSQAHAAVVAAPAAEPVVVRPGAPRTTDFAIPPPGTAAKPRAAGAIQIDMAAVEAKLRETHAVSALLGSIFQEESEPAHEPPSTPDEEETLAGLDASHSALLRRLAAQGSWTRDAFDLLAAELGLMPDGALETLNEAAFDLCGAPLFEADDPIEIDPHILKEMMP